MGWQKINARKDVNNPSWFKFKHKFFEDSEFFEFSAEEKLCWVYFLCEASKKNADGTFILSIQHANHVANLSKTIITSAIKKLQRLKLVTIRTLRERDADGTYTCSREEKRREEEIREEKDFSCQRSEETLPAAIANYSSLESVFQERRVSIQIQERWTQAFPDTEWVCNEIQKALAWEASNPTRKKKNFAAFITRWLTKGWDYRKTQSVSGNGIEWNKVFGKESA